MSWALLLLSGVFEILGIMALKELSMCFKKRYILGMILGFGGSFSCIIFVLQTLPMSIAYAVWTGIGAVGGVVVGVYKYKESKHPLKLVFIALILLCVLLLKLIS